MQKRLRSPAYVEDQLSFDALHGTLSVVVNRGPLPTDPNIPKWISLPIMDRGRDLEVSSPDHTTLQRRKLRQIPERFIRGHRLQQRTQDPHPKAWLPSSAPSPGQPRSEDQVKEYRGCHWLSHALCMQTELDVGTVHASEGRIENT